VEHRGVSIYDSYHLQTNSLLIPKPPCPDTKAGGRVYIPKPDLRPRLTGWGVLLYVITVRRM